MLPKWMQTLSNEVAAAVDAENVEAYIPRVPAPKRGEDMFADTDYPHDWDGFIGQNQAKEQLTVAAASAKHRNTRLEHTLLASGAHGIGKTTLAHLLAFNAGAGITCTTGPLDIWKARDLMEQMVDNDVLFIDEAHLLVSGGKAKAEWLLPFMTEGKLYSDQGPIKVPNITIVAATTDAGKLPETILSRFMTKPRLVPYSDEEATLIVANLAARMDVDVAPDDLPKIAAASSGNPRDMRSILTAVRDLKIAYPNEEYLEKALDWAGFSSDGLTVLAQEILVVLSMQPNYTASLDSLGSMLSEPGPLKHHEQALLQRGYVTITGRGRQLTQPGVARAAQLRGTL